MNTTIKKLIAVYARVSTAKQEEDGTIETQLMAVREFAETNGYLIIEQYVDDGWSGDSIVRPELDRLRNEAKEAKWEAVLIYDPDRLARRYSYQEYVKDEINENGKEVLYVTMAPAKNGEEKLMGGVRGLFTEYERIKISERMRLGKLRKVKEGHLLVSDPAYGYDYLPKIGKIDGYYKINEEEAKVVRLIFGWLANDGLTIQKIILKLQALDIKPRKSKRGVWANSTLSTLFKNTAYIGKARWGSSYAVIPDRPMKDLKYKKVKKTSRRIKPKDEWFYIPVPKIIDEELFNKAQDQLKINFDRNKRNKVNEYLLSGLIFCNCGRRRTGEGVQNNKHLYYRCTDRVMSFPLPRQCFEKGINAKLLDVVIWDRVSNIMTSPKLLTVQLERWIGKTNKKESSTGLDLEFVKGELLKLKEQEDRYNKGYGAGAFSLEQLKDYTEPIRKKVLNLQTQVLNEKSKANEHKDNIIVPNEENIKHFSKVIKSNINQLNFDQKKGIMTSIVQKVVGNNNKLLVEGYIPLNITNNYEYKTEYRYCWSSKCRQINPFQRANEKGCFC